MNRLVHRAPKAIRENKVLPDRKAKRAKRVPRDRRVIQENRALLARRAKRAKQVHRVPKAIRENRDPRDPAGKDATLTAATTSAIGAVKMAAAVADAAGDNVTKAEFNALLTSLRNAGILSTT